MSMMGGSDKSLALWMDGLGLDGSARVRLDWITETGRQTETEGA